LVLRLMEGAGFEEAVEVDHGSTIMGRIVYFQAVRPHALASGAA
jgi:hypothetical protein